MKTYPSFLAALALFAFAVTACDRERTRATAQDVRQSTKEVAKKTERQIEKAGVVLDDATITAKIKTALIAESGAQGFSVDVDTSDNVVTLNGTVVSDGARARAEEIARKTQGVKEVRNKLTVKPAS